MSKVQVVVVGPSKGHLTGRIRTVTWAEGVECDHSANPRIDSDSSYRRTTITLARYAPIVQQTLLTVTAWSKRISYFLYISPLRGIVDEVGEAAHVRELIHCMRLMAHDRRQLSLDDESRLESTPWQSVYR
jgi:hypothetical protein